jgi:general secretion pathway protein D
MESILRGSAPMKTNGNSLKRSAAAFACGLAIVMMQGCASKPKQATPEAASAGAVPVATEAAKQAASANAAKAKYEIHLGTGELVKAPAAIPVKTGGGNMSFNFEGADIREVVRTILGDILRENYIVDPRVGGSVVLRTAKPIPQSAVLPALEEVLRMNGAILIREADGVYHIVPSALAGKGNLTPQLGDVRTALPSGYSIQIVPLKYLGVVDMARILEPLAEPGAVRADPLRNLMILAGTQTQLRHLMETIDMFDVDWIAGMSVGLFPLQNVDVKTLMGEVDKLFGDKSLAPWAGALRVVPIDRLNALLVVSPQAQYLERARTWIERLDRGGGAVDGARLYVYPVQNGKAEQLATLLNDLFSKQRTAAAKSAAVAPGLRPAEVSSTAAKPATTATTAKADTGASDAARVIADKDNNALLILASAAEYESIESAIRKLDIVPRQVLIEVTIAEVTLKDELKYGLEWYFSSGSKVSGKLDTGASGIAQLVPGLSAVFTGKAGDIKGVLNALASDSKLKVISSPRVTVTDNQTAKIQVGDKVPTISQTQTVTGTTTTSGIISTVQYIETGVLLSVTPRINAGGLVGLEINQEVSNATNTTTSGIDSPTIQKRAAESTVTVQSGETLILAGLIKEDKTRASSGVPLLSEVPLLGGLFGSQSVIDNRTELVILITPHVMETPKQAAEITQEFRKRMTGLERLMKEAGVVPDTHGVDP